jgi:hypothetical protein
MGLLHLSLLFGMFAVLIPPLLHLLRRRRDEIVDWGAMQFLPRSVARQRRRLLDELLLLIVRMAVVALVVLALASPYAVSPWLAPLGDGTARDIVLVLDGSYSMARHIEGGPTPGEAARRWAEDFVANMGRNDRVALLNAREPPVLWQELTGERRELAGRLAELPAPRGNSALPRAVGEAWDLLQARARGAGQQIIVLSDGQRYGWADPETLRSWEALGDRWHAQVEKLRVAGEAIPGLWAIDVAPAARISSNFSLAPLHSQRGVALTGQKLTFRGAVQLDGFTAPTRPRRLYFEIDGKFGGEVPLSDALSIGQGRIPVAFAHRFETAGAHLVSLKLEAAEGMDCLPADNEQHTVVEVVDELPLLLVDGERRLSAESSTFFLQRALTFTSDNKGRSPRALPAHELTAKDLFRLNPPAVVILADVPRLSTSQAEALDRYVADGGSVLVALGERVAPDMEFYNERLYRDGHGWLPARLLEVAAAPGEPVAPNLKTFTHPALELLGQDTHSGLGQARFPRWWKVRVEGPVAAAPMALLSNGDPLLLEKTYKKGRVVLCTVPLDRSWGSALPSTWEYPVLVPELVYYLAGVRAEASRLGKGSPLRYEPRGERLGLPASLVLRTPEKTERFEVTQWPWSHDDTGANGVYRVECGGEHAYFITPPDLREADLRAATEEERRLVADLLPIPLQNEPDREEASLARPRQDLWWLFLLGVIVLLCGEVWFTRRLVKARNGADGTARR